MGKVIILNGKKIADFSIPYIIAEIGSNHNGDMEIAKKLIVKAKECGADAVKFQSWTPKSLISEGEYNRNQKYEDSPKKHFGSLKEMVEKYYLRTEQHSDLKKICDEVGITFCSTPFSIAEVDLLMNFDMPFIKVASMDINNPLLLKHIARQKKPVFLSTGMANVAEIDQAIRWIKEEGNDTIVLLHCIALYPPKLETVNLNNITMLRQAFNLPVGFSDHSIGVALPLASSALGACVIEKHFTLDKNMDGWDHDISADPEDLRIICQESANISRALGGFERIVSDAEKEKMLKFRRSVILENKKNQGDIITLEDITFKRPATGISPVDYNRVVGRVLKNSVEAGEMLKWEDLI